jgi:hypothetical protein
MAYDIYGNNLRRGHCEVHPDVHEEYPCSLCYMEQSKHKEREMAEREHYEQWEQAIYKEEVSRYCTAMFWQYRLLTKVEKLINRLSFYVNKRKDYYEKKCPV